MRRTRSADLRIVAAAAKVRKDFPDPHRTSFDVVRAARQLGFPVIFQPTENLLGATIALGEDCKGILVTTNRNLSTQRFTLAHELGHILLNHPMQFDLFSAEEAFESWAPVSSAEDAASTFASELLASKESTLVTAVRMGWGPDRLSDPTIVYQLSLRLGVSYQAMCWSLAGNRLIGREIAEQLATAGGLKGVKRALLTPGESLKDARADVWQLGESDNGTMIEAGQNDTFVLQMTERPSTGFRWNFDPPPDGLTVLSDETTPDELYGGGSSRRLRLQPDRIGRFTLRTSQLRPWNQRTEGLVSLDIHNYGKEDAGLPREVRELRLAEQAT